MLLFTTVLPLLLLGAAVSAQTVELAQLPAPDTSGGKPLMEVLKDRQTSRSFSSDSLSTQMLSNLLWAACGVNRPETGKRTAPSAMNWQEIDVYAALPHGLYLYRPVQHDLVLIMTVDIRSETGTQAFVAEAPLNLVYVADYSRMGNGTAEDKHFYAAADAAFISQNVYLFCASENLATVVRGSVDREALAAVMQLRPEQHVVFAQTVGYPHAKD